MCQSESLNDLVNKPNTADRQGMRRLNVMPDADKLIKVFLPCVCVCVCVFGTCFWVFIAIIVLFFGSVCIFVNSNNVVLCLPRD